jgi:hypothetical protein
VPALGRFLQDIGLLFVLDSVRAKKKREKKRERERERERER